MERDVLPVICIQQPRGAHTHIWPDAVLGLPVLALLWAAFTTVSVHWLICLPTNQTLVSLWSSWIRTLVSWFLGALHAWQRTRDLYIGVLLGGSEQIGFIVSSVWVYIIVFLFLWKDNLDYFPCSKGKVQHTIRKKIGSFAAMFSVPSFPWPYTQTHTYHCISCLSFFQPFWVVDVELVGSRTCYLRVQYYVVTHEANSQIILVIFDSSHTHVVLSNRWLRPTYASLIWSQMNKRPQDLVLLLVGLMDRVEWGEIFVMNWWMEAGTLRFKVWDKTKAPLLVLARHWFSLVVCDFDMRFTFYGCWWAGLCTWYKDPHSSITY